MTALYITITEPNHLHIDNLCREDATKKEIEIANAIEGFFEKVLSQEVLWKIKRESK